MFSYLTKFPMFLQLVCHRFTYTIILDVSFAVAAGSYVSLSRVAWPGPQLNACKSRPRHPA